MICLDSKIENGTFFSFAKMLIETCSFLPIQGWVYLSIEERGYDIFVKEFDV